MPSAQELLSALLPYIELKEGVDEEKALSSIKS